MPTIPNYEFHAAGDVWLVPEYHLVELPDGTLGVSLSECRRIHLGILRTLCFEPGEFSAAEKAFVKDVFYGLEVKQTKAAVREVIQLFHREPPIERKQS